MKKTLLATLLLTALSAHAESVFRRDNGAEPKSIDPQLTSEDSGGAIVTDLFEGLIRQKANGDLEPAGASSWEISPDGKTYTFHLRPNKWSDGTPVTAADYVYAWQRGVDPKVGSHYSFILYPIKNAQKIASGAEKDVNQLGVKALDDKTLQVTLENPTPYFLQLLTHYTTKPVPKHTVEKYGKEWTRPEHIVSNGAYHMTQWLPQSRLVAEKSNTYWDKDHVAIDKVIFYPIEDRNSAISRYRAGEIDYMPSPPSEMLDWIQKEIPNELIIAPALSTYYYGFNINEPPFKDNIALRKALSMALDRNIIVKNVLRNGQTPAYGIVPPNTANADPYTPDYGKLPRAKQIELAKKYYAEAGYSKDHPLKIKISYNTNEGHKQIAIATAAMWKQILGVDTELENFEWKVLLSKLSNKQLSLFRSGWNGDYNDPFTFLELFRSDSGQNHTNFSSPEYDALLDKAAATADLKERAKILHDAEKILIDSYAILPFYHYVKVKLLKPYVKGYQNNVMGQLPTQYLSIQK